MLRVEALTFIGCALLCHGAYSSYEIHQILQENAKISRDIIYELLLGLILLNFGTIKGFRNIDNLTIRSGRRVLSPEMYLRPIELSKATAASHESEFTNYEMLESRVDFLDVCRLRRDHVDAVGL